MTDMDCIPQIKRLDQFGKVVSIGVEVVAVPGLTGSAMAATVMADDAVAIVGEKEHLVLPRIGGERPSMAEHDRLPLTPILEVDLCAILRCERRHRVSFRAWVKRDLRRCPVGSGEKDRRCDA